MSIKYSEDHEWIVVEGDIATVGITDFAQAQLGDIVFIELPEVGHEMSAGDDVAVVESVKAASEIYAPLTGEVTEINEALEEAPDTVNKSPMDEGWFFKIKLSDTSEIDGLMDEAGYKAFVAEQE